MEIKEGRRGTRAHRCDAGEQCIFPHTAWNQTRGAIGFVVLSGNLHLEDFVGMAGILDLGVCHQSDQASLKSTEAALDFPLGLGSWCDQVRDPKSAQSTLKLALGIDAVIAGTGAEEAQSVGVDYLRDAMGLEGLTEVQEVIPGRVGGDEASSEIEAGMIIDGEQ